MSYLKMQRHTSASLLLAQGLNAHIFHSSYSLLVEWCVRSVKTADNYCQNGIVVPIRTHIHTQANILRLCVNELNLPFSPILAHRNQYAVA